MLREKSKHFFCIDEWNKKDLVHQRCIRTCNQATSLIYLILSPLHQSFSLPLIQDAISACWAGWSWRPSLQSRPPAPPEAFPVKMGYLIPPSCVGVCPWVLFPLKMPGTPQQRSIRLPEHLHWRLMTWRRSGESAIILLSQVSARGKLISGSRWSHYLSHYLDLMTAGEGWWSRNSPLAIVDTSCVQ